MNVIKVVLIGLLLVFSFISCNRNTESSQENNNHISNVSQIDDANKNIMGIQYSQNVAENEHETLIIRNDVERRLPGRPIQDRIMYVNSRVAIRDNPDERRATIGSLNFGTEVIVVREMTRYTRYRQSSGRWVYIQSPVEGWVFDAFLSEFPDGTIATYKITFPNELNEITAEIYPTHIEVKFNISRWMEPYLVFSDDSRENMMDNVIVWTIGSIRIFNTTNIDSEYRITELSSGTNALFRISQLENWLFLPNYGFVYIFDFPLQTYPMHENELSEQFPKFRRYGPLLEVHHNDRVIRFWTSGSETGFLGIGLAAYFEEYEEILLQHSMQGSSILRIFSLRLEQYTDFIGGWPFFNDSRDIVISANSEDHTIFIDVFTINNGIYTRVLRERVSGHPERSYWINDNEFRIEVRGRSNLLIKRINGNFELIDEQ